MRQILWTVLFTGLMCIHLTPPAQAASNYDDLVKLTGTLSVKTANASESIDITDDYENYMDDNSFCYSNNFASYQDAVANGAVTIIQAEDSNGNTYVKVGWLDSNQNLEGLPNTFWSAYNWNPSWSGYGLSVYYADAYIFSTSNDSSVSVSCTYNPNDSVTGEVLFSTSAVAPVTMQNAKIYTSTQAVESPSVSAYPAGYAGRVIPTTPPVPVPITGAVDCGDSSLQPISMLIYQGGDNDGAATLTNVSSGVANWAYNLYKDSPYTFTVECAGVLGGGVAKPHGTVIPSETSGSWMCTLAGLGPNYCVLL
jgi:hypothetical protein